MIKIKRATLRRLRLPLIKPYRLSYRTFEEFEPFVVEVEAVDGRMAFGDGHISPGSSSETRVGGWDFLVRHLAGLPGVDTQSAKKRVLGEFEQSKVAATACATAIEMLEHNPMLHVKRTTRLPILTPIGSLDRKSIEAEVEEAIGAGFTTFKIKVGTDVLADIERLGWIQAATQRRATLRIDANRAYSREDAIKFTAGIDPEGVELFEQPCDADDWQANADVARRSRIPLMLDEPICSLADIERAGELPGVEYCKVKLKRFGSLEGLKAGIDHIYGHDMTPVLGDGLGSEIHSWLEACVAARSISNAGEFNGFLKPVERLFTNPLPFSDGAITLAENYWPELDRNTFERLTVETREFG